MATLRDQWDILIYHNQSDHAVQLVQQLKSLINGLRNDVGEEVKVASTTELFNTGSMFDSMDDALRRWVCVIFLKLCSHTCLFSYLYIYILLTSGLGVRSLEEC